MLVLLRSRHPAVVLIPRVGHVVHMPFYSATYAHTLLLLLLLVLLSLHPPGVPSLS
jgi:hypothetical protein